MANTAFRCAARLVLATFAAHVSAGDGSANGMMQQLIDMRNSVHHGQQAQQQSQSSQNYYDSQSTGAGAASTGQQSVADSQQAAKDYYDAQAQQANQGHYDSQDTGGDMAAMTTHKPSFMGNSSPKNRAIVTGVVAGAGVAAVAGGIAIAIEENKIQQRIKAGKPVKPIFPWLAKKVAASGGEKDWGSPGGGSKSGSRPSFSARVVSSGDKGASKISARVTATLPPTMAPTLPPRPTTTGAPKLGDEIPMVVWIALGVLACCCLAALICACFEAVKHSGRKKRTVKSKTRDVSSDALRSDSLDSDYSARSEEGDGSYYDDQSYAAVAPQEVYYPTVQYDYSQQYTQQAPYQTADNVSYQSAGGLSYSEYTPQASYALTDASHYSQYTESANSYVPSLHHNPHPNAQSYVDPHTNLYHYNTNG